MKKQILVGAFAALLSIGAATAQQGGGNFQRKTPEERVQAIHAKFDSVFHLDASKQAQVDSAFLTSYKEQDKKMEEMRAGGGMPDRDAMMAFRKQLTDDRDAKLKAVLTEDQMKKWKDEIEPSMRPQRGPRPGGN